MGIVDIEDLLPSGSDGSREVLMVLPSDVELVPIIEAVTSHISRDLKLGAEASMQISLAVIEGAMNAIKHGNKYDLAKRAYFKIRIDADRLTLIIKDEGEGFDPRKVADPLEDEGLLRDHGRGLLMIRAYVDEAYHNADGTQLTMVKYLHSGQPGTDSEEDQKGEVLEL